jgi:hypothetical protein
VVKLIGSKILVRNWHIEALSSEGLIPSEPHTSYVSSSLLVAGLAGWLLESWLFFCLVLCGLIVMNLQSNEIRPARRGR